MKLVGLPGRNPETEPWMQAVLADPAPAPGRIQVARYRHWQEGGEPDVGYEASRLNLTAEDGVIAKSMGTLVLLAQVAGGHQPGWAVLIGTPLNHYDEVNVQRLTRLVASIPVLFIQQKGDFTCPCDRLRNLVGDVGLTEVIEVVGEDHVYRDVDELRALIGSWVEAHAQD
jgi:hypothetical protein